jgi:hypothetical protein
MRFRVGSFTCELSMEDGDLKAKWMPWQPMYLNKAQRAEYAAYRTLFLECREQQRARQPAQPDKALPQTNVRLRLVESPPAQASQPDSDRE